MNTGSVIYYLATYVSSFLNLCKQNSTTVLESDRAEVRQSFQHQAEPPLSHAVPSAEGLSGIQAHSTMKRAGKYLTFDLTEALRGPWRSSAVLHWKSKRNQVRRLHRDPRPQGRIRSVPGNSTVPLTISPMMHPTDHMSTGNRDEMSINKNTEIDPYINKTSRPLTP